MTYPYQVLRVPGAEALKTLMDLRSKGAGVPVILGNQETYERMVESFELNDESTPDQLIEAALQIDVSHWLKEREAENPEYYAAEPAEPTEWPEDDQSPNTSITAHCDVLTRKPHSEVVIAVIPAGEPWMVPCYLKIGNWNEVPKAEEHAALFKYWAESYGAKVACIADDIIELTVDRPASSRKEALALAKQQFVYCADIVHQGVGSVEALAATLLGATVWYFWWD